MTKIEIIEKFKNNEKAMKRINKAISGEREMEGTYLEVTIEMINGILTFEEVEEISKENKDYYSIFEEAIREIMTN